MHKGKILLIEDDPGTITLIKDTMEREGYYARSATTLQTARNEISKSIPGLIILDRKLPDGDGIDFCREIRAHEKTQNIPILFLTALGTKNDKITGFKVGGDDYLIKPFDFEELVARIEAMFRRIRKATPVVPVALRAQGIVLDINRHECFVDGKPMKLWPKEFELLRIFLEKKGQVLNKDFLAEHVWNHEYLANSRTIDITIQRLRKKLGKRKNLIETVKGYGFKLSDK